MTTDQNTESMQQDIKPRESMHIHIKLLLLAVSTASLFGTGATSELLGDPAWLLP
jgi:hypothetical protein